MLRDTLKVSVVVLVVCGGLLCWSLGPHIERRVNEETEQRWGWVVFPSSELPIAGLGVTVMPKTAITFGDRTVQGTITLDGSANIDPTFELHWGDVMLTIGDGFYDITSPGLIISWASGVWEYDENNEAVFAFSITATGHYVDRLMATDPIMKEDNAAATHSVERYAEDKWEADAEEGTIAVTFGELSWNGVNGTNNTPEGEMEETIDVIITPASYIHAIYEANWGEDTTGCIAVIQTDLFDFDFDAVQEEQVAGVGTVYLVGSGNTLTWYSDAGGSGYAGPGVTVWMPRIADWSNLGLCNWGEIIHNVLYDDVLVWGGFRKTAALDAHFTWPLLQDTEVSGEGEGEFAYGDSICVRLGELRALGQYVQKVQPFSEAAGWTRPTNWYEFWPGPGILLRVDSVSARAHNLYPTGEDHPHRIVFGVHGLTETDMTADPHWDIQASRHNTDADTPANATGRPSAWESEDFVVTGGAVESTGNVTFTVGAGGGTLYRDIVDNWLSRIEALIEYGNDTGEWAPFPVSYMVQRANAFREEFPEWADLEWDGKSYEEGDEDVHYYSAHRHLVLSVSGPALGTVPIYVRLSRRPETVTDDRTIDLTGPSGTRGVSANLGTAQMLLLEGEYDSAAGTITVDLAQVPYALPELKHVSKVEVIFEAAHAGEWTLSGMELQGTNALATFHEDHHAYRSGGLRGVVNGVYPHALVSSGNYRVWAGQEQLVEAINWYYTLYEILGLVDGSYAIGLEGYLRIARCCTEGWEWELPTDWDALRIDADEAVLTPGYSFDVAERQDATVATVYPGRFGVRYWDTAELVPYAPHGVLVVQGGLHGLASAANGTTGEIWRYVTGQAAEIAASDVTSDADGYWAHGDAIVQSYDDTTPTYWQYLVGGEDVGRLYERQWVAAYLPLPQCREPFLALDPCGTVWLAANDGANNIRVYHRESPQRPWALRGEAFADALHEQPTMAALEDGRLRVWATRTDDASVDMAESTDGGETWT